METDCHFIQEVVDKEVLTLPHVSSDLQKDITFKKSMAQEQHHFLVGKLMPLDPSSPI